MGATPADTEREITLLRGDMTAALEQVERQMQLTRERRQQLEDVEGRLWARRNRLEQFLIHTRGLAWWRARRDTARAEALATDPTSTGR